MSVPQAGGAAAHMDNAPKTIKLKRPGEMSTIKVSVPGGAANAGPRPAPAAAEATADSASATQKKTIRVKRPTMPAAAGVVGEGAEPGAPGQATMAPVTIVASAPERGTGWFIAVAAACILVAIGIMLLFSTQSYSWPFHTELDSSCQQG